MGAQSFVALWLLSIFLSNGFCLPVARDQNKAPAEVKRQKDFALTNSLGVLQSMDSRLQKLVKEVQLETNEVEALAKVAKNKPGSP
ncbi:hypothetical protein OJAV_G00118410 [Oryzias javanicus]|uniref:Uncharacterized protein n=1 Tax=Oryzias javanicus TaxID=123683 RepID=A0A3S2PZQ1_ORYJA|nr:hypothetical protein OJAV_G00118410 [Oryzias javanicus]